MHLKEEMTFKMKSIVIFECYYDDFLNFKSNKKSKYALLIQNSKKPINEKSIFSP